MLAKNRRPGVLLALLMLGPTYAATVPEGTVLDLRQEIVRHIKDEPASLDPAKAVGLPEIQVIRDLFEGLLNQNERGEVIPGVAERWETPDGKRYLFYLRKNARWSNGEPVVAEDFVYSWRRLVSPETHSPFAWFAALAGIEHAQEVTEGKKRLEELGVTALAPQTLQVTLNKPVPFFLNLMTHVSLYPVHRATVEKQGEQWTRTENLVGNGAFQLHERRVNEKLVLMQNRYYWDNAHTVLQKVTFTPINHETAATNRYLAGDIDITESFPKNRYHQLLKQLPDQVFTPDQLGTYYYAFNTQRAPLNDPRIRQALSLSIDRDIIAKKVVGSGEKPAWTLTPEVTVGFRIKDQSLQTMSQKARDAKALALLTDAGYGPHKPLKISLLYNTSENHEKIAVAISSMWKKKLGVVVKLTNQEWKSYIDSRNSGQFDVVRASWIGDYNEASTFLTLLTSKHSGNIARFASTDYDQILSQAENTLGSEQRNQLYNQAESLIQNYAPIAPIYQYTNARLIKPWVRGYPITNPEDVAYSHQLYIVKH